MDEQLQNLIDEVCQHAQATPERQKALHRLLVAVQKLPGILKSSHQDYLLALNKTWEWFCRNICEFEQNSPSLQDSLIKWINSYLRYRIKDLYPSENPNPISLDQPFSNNDGDRITLGTSLPDPQFTSLTLDLLDFKIVQLQEKKLQRVGQQVRQQILEEERGRLSECHPRNHPECHCQLLTLRLLLQEPPNTIADIAREFNINNQTLHSHWNRKCLPLLQDIARNCGYEP